MCLYRYREDTEANNLDRFCKLKKHYKKRKLPVDLNGLCIFHSQDLNWKKQNNFKEHLEYLVSHQNEENPINLRETHFIAEDDKIDYISLLCDTYLWGSTFHNALWVEDKRLSGRLAFESCHFMSHVVFEEFEIDGDFIFSDIKLGKDSNDELKKELYFKLEHCEFKRFSQFENFENFTSNFSINKCEFKQFYLSGFEAEQGRFEINDCLFDGTFTFSDATIKTKTIDFTSNTLIEEGEFENIALIGKVRFQNITVANSISFEGSSDRRIFHGITYFDINTESSTGRITFENVNLSRIENEDKEVLFLLAKENRIVTIEKGCQKYRLRSPKLKLLTGEEPFYVMFEMCNTYTNFFLKSMGKNLGVEILERTPEYVIYIYVSDENIEEDKFLEMLGLTSSKIFELLSGKVDIKDLDKDAHFYASVSLVSSIYKAAYEIQNNKWSLNETISFFNTLNPVGNIFFDEKATHTFLENVDVQKLIDSASNGKGFNLIVNQLGNNTYVDKNIQENKK